MSAPLDIQIESILFFKGEEISLKQLSKLLSVKLSEVEPALQTLQTKLEGRGMRLLNHNNKVSLVTAPETSELIEAVSKEELSKELSKAALETLAIIMYRGPVKRSEVDYIRGVNSQFSIRNLLIRGLIEKIDQSDDMRSFSYGPSADLLKHLGVTSLSELSNFETITSQLQDFIDNTENDSGND